MFHKVIKIIAVEKELEINDLSKYYKIKVPLEIEGN